MEREVDCTVSYTSLCRVMIVLVRVVHCFTNSKLWITHDNKGLLNQEKAAVIENNWEKRKPAQLQLKRRLKKG